MRVYDGLPPSIDELCKSSLRGRSVSSALPNACHIVSAPQQSQAWWLRPAREKHSHLEQAGSRFITVRCDHRRLRPSAGTKTRLVAANPVAELLLSSQAAQDAQCARFYRQHLHGVAGNRALESAPGAPSRCFALPFPRSKEDVFVDETCLITYTGCLGHRQWVRKRPLHHADTMCSWTRA